MEERIGNPLYLADCWKDIPPSPDGTIGRGSVKRAPEGREKYRRVYADSTKMSPLLAAFKMIRERYDESFREEVLLLVYDTDPGDRKRSTIPETVHGSQRPIAERVEREGSIGKERYRVMISSSWEGSKNTSRAARRYRASNEILAEMIRRSIAFDRRPREAIEGNCVPRKDE
jgi:hypothetical protein